MTIYELADQCVTCQQVDTHRWSVWIDLAPLGVQGHNQHVKDYPEEYLARGRRDAVAGTVEALLRTGALLLRDGKIALEEQAS